MGLFELLFALTAVILGLALTNIVSSMHRLALAGRKVRWAPEPVLLTILVGMILVSVWLGQWFVRDMTEMTAGRALLQVLKMMALYFAAASCLPEPGSVRGEPIDLFKYYDDTRALSFGALIVGLMLFDIYHMTDGSKIDWNELLQDLLLIAAYASLIFIRSRWYNVLVLTAVLGLFGNLIVGVTLTQSAG